jgi:L-seryl-tRNA(Ser) seleniumtransferase
LIEIGDGFRIPDIMARSGTKLREVGTTNRTQLADYRDAVSERTRMLLRVHPSNFRVVGFTARPSLSELVALGSELHLPVVEDLGSGCLYDFAQQGFEDEPPVVESLRAGADLVTFSGDKLLGGPQAGIIAGKSRWVARLKRKPFFRAVRCDKLILAALQTTVDAYLALTPGANLASIPVWNMLTISEADLRGRAATLLGLLKDLPLTASIGHGTTPVGGGTLPRAAVDSVTVDLEPRGLDLAALASRLRGSEPPVIGTVSGGRFRINLRTVFPGQDLQLVRAIRGVFGATPGVLA